MKMIRSLTKSIDERLFSTNNQIQRIIVLLGIAIVLAVVSFGGYYYYDRYYSSQPGVVEQTLAEAEQAVRDDPQNAEKRLSLAEKYMAALRYDEALAQANQVSSSDPENQVAWLVIGVSNASTGKPAEAIEPLTKLYEARKDEEMPGLDRQLQTAAYYLGDSYLQLGQPEKAVVPLEMGAGWSGTDADVLYKLGLAYSGIQEYDKAAAVLQRATAFVPDFLEVYQAMVTVYESSSQPDLVTYARGMVAYSQKDYDTALDLLLKAVQAQPGFAPASAGLGLTYEAMGDLKNAKASYETAAMLDPTNYTASQGVLRTEAALKK